MNFEGKLLLYKNERKIISPFCEITFKLENGASMEDFIESLNYWGVEYRDMNAEYSGAMEMFEQNKSRVQA